MSQEKERHQGLQPDDGSKMQKELPSPNSLLRRQPPCTCQELCRRSKKPWECYWVHKFSEQADGAIWPQSTIGSTCGPQVWENIQGEVFGPTK